jgi:hypothetical protein
MAISRPPSSAAVCIIGILTGQMYRSDLANLKVYRLPPSIIKFSRRFLQPLVGSLRPARRSNRALPEGPGVTTTVRNAETPMPQNEEVITTARTAPGGATPRTATAHDEESSGDTGPSVMREWVNELTGRTERANAGIRVPPEAEILQLTTMFPHPT